MAPRGTLPVVSIDIAGETIRLTQLLKLASAVGDGAEAKFRIAGGEVLVNGVVEMRRGRKLQRGDRVEFAGETYEIACKKPGG